MSWSMEPFVDIQHTPGKINCRYSAQVQASKHKSQLRSSYVIRYVGVVKEVHKKPPQAISLQSILNCIRVLGFFFHILLFLLKHVQFFNTFFLVAAVKSDPL